MAERRMFAKTIIDSDAFLDMPLSTQALYFHLSMRADDEGFVNNPKKIARMIGADDDSLRILVSKQYLIPFESGVVVIKHWKIHNYIRGDRLTETSCKQEKSMLSIDENGAYSILDDIKEIQALDSGDKRKLAYQNSTLPYSFTYKMKRAFEGKTCPLCGCKMSSSTKKAMPTIQHNKPISDGGEHELHNISVICLSCNTSIQNQETGELNNSEVIEMWDRIVYADKHKIKWFFDLSLLENVYKEEMSDTCQTSDGQVPAKCLTQVRLGKDRLGKDRLGKDRLELEEEKEPCGSPSPENTKPAIRHKYGEYSNVLLSDSDMDKLKTEFPNDWTERIERLSSYMASTGKSYKNHLATIRSWSRRETPAEKKTSYNLSDFEKLSMNFSLYGDDEK